MLKKHQNISFSWAGASHQNGAAELNMKMLVTMEIPMLMHSVLICTNDTFSTYFWKCKWTILYGSKVGSLICSKVYKLFGKFDPYMFWSPVYRILEWKPLNGIKVFKEVLIWDLERFNQHNFCCFWIWWMFQCHFNFILYWLYIVLCCEKQSPRYRSLDMDGHVKEINHQVNPRPRKWSIVVWRMFDCQWVVGTF